MKLKKNAKADLGRYSVIFFQVGLILVLAFTYVGMEWEFTEKDVSFKYDMRDFDEEQEEIPITQLNTPPPPPPPPVPEIVQVVEDNLDIEEVLIQSPERNQDAKIEIITPISAIEEAVEEEEIENVAFIIVEQIPLYPGCENIKSKVEQIKCMNEKVHSLFGKEFNTGVGAELDLFGVHRIFIIFKIDNNGDVVEIRTRGPHKRFEAEAERVARLLPKMIPGKQRGKPVDVTFSLPLVFEVSPAL